MKLNDYIEAHKALKGASDALASLNMKEDAARVQAIAERVKGAGAALAWDALTADNDPCKKPDKEGASPTTPGDWERLFVTNLRGQQRALLTAIAAMARRRAACVGQPFEAPKDELVLMTADPVRRPIKDHTAVRAGLVKKGLIAYEPIVAAGVSGGWSGRGIYTLLLPKEVK